MKARIKPQYDKMFGTHYEVWVGDKMICTVWHGEYAEAIKRAVESVTAVQAAKE